MTTPISKTNPVASDAVSDKSQPLHSNDQTNISSNLPVLAKDSHYLSRLERELARADVSQEKASKHKQSDKDADNSPDEKQSRVAKEYHKKRVQYDKIKTRSQQMVQARIDSIPVDLPAKLNLDLPVSQRAEDLIQAIIDQQVIIVAGET